MLSLRTLRAEALPWRRSCAQGGAPHVGGLRVKQGQAGVAFTARAAHVSCAVDPLLRPLVPPIPHGSTAARGQQGHLPEIASPADKGTVGNTLRG
jgi:hypothetical protein